MKWMMGAVLALGLGGCSWQDDVKVSGAGALVEQQHPLGREVTRVLAGVPANIHLVAGAASGIHIRGQGNLLPYLELTEKGDKLEMLDRNGSPIQSPLNYTLEPVKASLPTTPMAMRGMYFYMADAATFTDCATGKRVAVANNAQLERDYAAARGTDTRPVLLVVEGHFTLEANPDTGEMMKTLMTDQAGKFIPGKDCSH